MSDISVHVNITPGTHINRALQQMLALANRTECRVDADFNEIKVMVRPGGNIMKAMDDYEGLLKSKTEHKILVAE